MLNSMIPLDPRREGGIETLGSERTPAIPFRCARRRFIFEQKSTGLIEEIPLASLEALGDASGAK